VERDGCLLVLVAACTLKFLLAVGDWTVDEQSCSTGGPGDSNTDCSGSGLGPGPARNPAFAGIYSVEVEEVGHRQECEKGPHPHRKLPPWC
jgi:hypothetical protein